MVGEANEASVCVGDAQCLGLLDTGSTVSTVSNQFYQDHLQELVLQPVEEILRIECAGGQHLPYLGFIEADVSVFDLEIKEKSTVLLVVPDTDYNARVPLLLGTNILRPLMETCRCDKGQQFLQKVAKATPWWLTFRCLSVEDRAVTRAKGRLGLVKSANSATIHIPSNSVRTVTGFITDAVPCARLAMVHPTLKTTLPAEAEVTPTLVDFMGDAGTVEVEVSNATNRPIVISPRSVLCELQQVDVEEGATAADGVNNEEDSKECAQTEEDFLGQFVIDDEELTPEQIQRFRTLLIEYRDVFSTGDFDIGHTQKVTHRIDLTDEVPFKQRHRSIPPSMYEEVRTHLKQLLKHGIITESNSPWASGIVLVKKKDGRLRFCIDYRQLNQRTVKDSYALPRIDEMIDHLIGAKYFSSLDMRSGYYQVEVEEDHKPRTAFTVGPLGFYQCERMPFGLTNAPATFQRLMQRTLGDLHMKECLTFVDDIIVHGRTFDEELLRLEHVLQKLREQNLKLNPKKCEFLRRRVKYCGHIVSEHGVETDPAKTQKIADWPTPKNVDDVRQFLGFSSYYRRFVQGFSKTARPLTDLLIGTQGKKSKMKPDPTTWTWGAAQEQAFNTLKEKLTTPPILAYADYKRPFILYTDASRDGLGAVLSQNSEDGRERVIAYASRGLSGSERNYPAHKMEYLALKWSITDKFHDYLYGNAFRVLTDNNPLTYVLSTARLDATGHRWLAALSAYNFDVKYRPGVANANADILSRLPKRMQREAEETDTETEDGPEDTPESEYKVITRDSIAAICKMVVPDAMVETLCLSTQILDDQESDVTDEMTPRDLRNAQRQDPVLERLIPFVTSQKKPSRNQLPGGIEAQQYIRDFDHLMMKRGVLHRRVHVDGQDRYQLVLPRQSRSTALQGLHDDIGHMGRDKTLDLVRDRYYWPRMASDVEEWVRNCMRCKVSKAAAVKAPLVNIVTTQPLELVCLDYLSLEMSQGGYENVLVITDHFTRYAQAIPTRNQTAKTTAEVFVNNFVVHYGLPSRIHTDQGRNFESNLMKEMCTVLGIEKSHTTPYHAMGNGLCEKFNQTLIGMLKTLEEEKKRNWKAHVAPLVHAYNASRQASTKYAPFYLMFGRQPRLPIDLVLGCPTDDKDKGHTKFVENLRENLKVAYEKATKEANKARDNQKRNYDVRARKVTIEPRDRVLVKVLAHEGKHKLADRWEQHPYMVLEQPNDDIPVFVVQREDGQGAVRTLHRNNLLPISTLPIAEELPDRVPDKAEAEKPVKKPTVVQRPIDDVLPETESVEPNSEDDDSSGLYLFLEDTEEAPVTILDAGASTVSENREDTSQGVEDNVSQHREESSQSGENSQNGEESSQSRDNSQSGEENLQSGEENSQGGENSSQDREERSSPSLDSTASGSFSLASEQADEDAGASLLHSGEEEVEEDAEDAASIEGEVGSVEGHSDVELSDQTEDDETETQAQAEASPVKSPPKPRRSTRKRTQTQLFGTNLKQMPTTHMSTLAAGNSWEQKAEFLAKLAMTDNFSRIPDSFCQAILKIVSVD